MFDEKSSGQQFKELCTGTLKFAFWCLFLYHVGIFHIAASIFQSNEEREATVRNNQVLNQFIDSALRKIEVDIKKGEAFSPYEYFAIVRRKTEIEDSVGYSMRPLNFQAIMDYMDKYVRNGTYTYDHIDAAREEYMKIPKKKYPKINYAPPHVCNKYIHKVTLKTIPQWIWHVYKNMLLYAFLMLLLWVYQRKDRNNLSLRSPLSFLFLVLVHPIYMTIVIVRWWRENILGFYASVEMRRRKRNIFEKFSKEEQEAIRAFAKSAVTFREFICWASKFGERQHLVLMAIAAVIILHVGSQFKAYASVSTDSDIVLSTPTGEHTTSIDVDVGVSSVSYFLQGEFDWGLKPIVFLSNWTEKVFHFLLLCGYTQTREPVPIEC